MALVMQQFQQTSLENHLKKPAQLLPPLDFESVAQLQSIRKSNQESS
jgi:hypothetical protein